MQKKALRALLNSTLVLFACGIVFSLPIIPTPASGIGNLDITEADGALFPHIKHSLSVRLNGETLFDGYSEGKYFSAAGTGLWNMKDVSIGVATKSGDRLEIVTNYGMMFDNKRTYSCLTPKTTATVNYSAMCIPRDGSIVLEYVGGR